MSRTWNFVASSVKGTSHEKLGTPCQDAHDAVIAEGLLIGAIADGAGSVSRADTASMLAVETAINHLQQVVARCPVELDGEIIKTALADAIGSARLALESEANRQSLELREFSTTLILFVASADWIVASQIGDGAIIILSEEDQLLSVTRPPVGEYANEVTFLTSETWKDSLQNASLACRMRCVAAFSDGLQRLALKFPDGEPYRPFFGPLFSLVAAETDACDSRAQLESFLSSPRINARTDDDKTLLLAALR